MFSSLWFLADCSVRLSFSSQCLQSFQHFLSFPGSFVFCFPKWKLRVVYVFIASNSLKYFLKDRSQCMKQNGAMRSVKGDYFVILFL